MASKIVNIYYFSWVREQIGKSEEIVELPENIITIKDMLDWMQKRDVRFHGVFSKKGLIRIAVDNKHVHDMNMLIREAREIAFFPPVTGG